MKGKQLLEERRKAEENNFQKSRLKSVADSYQDFARMLQFLPVEEEELTEADRDIYLKGRKMIENRKVLSGQLKSFAETCMRVAQESFEVKSLSDKSFKNAVIVLKEYRVGLRLGYYFRSSQKERMYFELKPLRFCKASLKEITGLLSVAFEKNMVCISHSELVHDAEYHTYEFEEQSRFQMMTGIARAIKEGKTISGDNHSIVHHSDHHVVFLLSDGVGSGRKAGQSSDVVMELMESLLHSGESAEAAMQFVNNAFSTVMEEGNMPTLDLCEVDLNQGSCEFMKAGGVVSFIKRGNEVEIVRGGGTPLGIFPGEEIPVHRRSLENDTYIIMLSDGILENLNGENTEAVFSDYISQLSYCSPKEIANRILQFAILRAGGKVTDDMTVFVAGIFEDCT